jgi:GT2 family glycosyltransferase
VVIDNASADQSVDNLRRWFPGVQVYANPTNIGHARAVNQGFTLVKGDYVLLLDADTELEAGAVDILLRFLADRPDVSMVAPRIYNTDGSVQETARNFPSVMSGLFGRHSLLTRLFPNNRFSRRYLLRDRLGATEPFQVEQVSAACMLFRRSLIDEAGPWDPGYEGYWVDTDWCMRLQRLDKKIYCVPKVRVVHRESNQPGKQKSLSRIWMFHRGAYRLYRKNFTWGVLDPRALFALVALSTRAALLAVQEGLRFHACPERVPEMPIDRAAPGQEMLP